MEYLAQCLAQAEGTYQMEATAAAAGSFSLFIPTVACLCSTKMVFFVQDEPPHQIFKGHEVAAMLKNELRKQKADFLVFRALEIYTVSE